MFVKFKVSELLTQLRIFSASFLCSCSGVWRDCDGDERCGKFEGLEIPSFGLLEPGRLVAGVARAPPTILCPSLELNIWCWWD